MKFSPKNLKTRFLDEGPHVGNFNHPGIFPCVLPMHRPKGTPPAPTGRAQLFRAFFNDFTASGITRAESIRSRRRQLFEKPQGTCHPFPQ